MDSTISREVVIGKQVIDSNGMIIGSVKDIVLDLESKKVSIKVTTKVKTEVIIEVGDIAAAGDVVLLETQVELPPQKESQSEIVVPQPATLATQPSESSTPLPPQTKPTGLCTSCGYQNDPGSRFCIKCGTKLR